MIKMKKYIILFLIFICLVYCKTVFAEDIYDVILFWGQSNMNGTAGAYLSSNGLDGEETIDKRVAVIGKNEFSKITEINLDILNNYTQMNHVDVPLIDNTAYEYLYSTNSLKKITKDTPKLGERLSYINNNLVTGSYPAGSGFYSLQQSYGTNIVPQFIKTYYDKTGHKVIAVMDANGGEQIAHFMSHNEAITNSLKTGTNAEHYKNQYIYEAMVTKYNAAIKYLTDNGYHIGNRIYVVFQGESNVKYVNEGTSSTNDYYNNFLSIHNNLKKDCGITLGGIIETAYTVGSNTNIGVQGINLAHEKLIKANKDIILASNYPYRKYVPNADSYYGTDYNKALSNSKYSVCITDVKDNTIHFNSAALSQIGLESATNIANYLNNKNVDKLTISDYKLDNNKKIILLENNTLKSYLDDQINYNGDYLIKDNKNNILNNTSILKTGDKLITSFMNKEDNYKIVILGDINGDGMLKRNDISLLAKHIINKNTITDSLSLVAADYNKDNTLKINDIMKMLKDTSTGDNIITYNLNGGINGPSTEIFKKNTTMRASNIIPKRTGYTFNGWKIDGTNTFVTAGESIPTSYKKVTLIAQWRINKVTIKLNMNGGVLNDTHGENVSSNNEYIIYKGTDKVTTLNYKKVLGINGLANYNNKSLVNITKTGYIAKDKEEWNTKSDGTGISYNQDIPYSASDFCNSSNKDCTITLYVNWIPKTITVEFNRNTSSSDTTFVRQQFKYGEEGTKKFGYNIDGEPKWEQTGQFGKWNYTNHTLLGWNTTRDATSAKWGVYSNVKDTWIDNNYPFIKLYGIWE